jgi:hypothetical protein
MDVSSAGCGREGLSRLVVNMVIIITVCATPTIVRLLPGSTLRGMNETVTDFSLIVNYWLSTALFLAYGRYHSICCNIAKKGNCMNSPLLACIAFGVFVIVARAPFIFWPEATITFYKEKIFSDAARIRLLAIIPILLALAMILTSIDLQNGFAMIVTSLGLIILAGCGLLMLIPDDIKDLVTALFDFMSLNVLQGVGVFSVVAALCWIYASFVYFGM